MCKLLVENKKIKLKNGYACDTYSKLYHTIYSYSELGNIVNECKYVKNIDFPLKVVDVMVKNIKSKLGVDYDLIMCIPSTHSGRKVFNLTKDIAKKLNIPFKPYLFKQTYQVQKYQKHKKEKLTPRLRYGGKENIKNKNILLIDDVCDTGASLKSAAKELSKHGVNSVTPIVITKTLFGKTT